MSRYKFSILHLLVLVFLIASVVAVLRHFVEWANEVFSLAIGILSISAIVAGSCRGRIRAFSAGFAFLGWG